jgi:putative acetyltransferase
LILRPATQADIAAAADVAARSYRAAFADILDAAALDARTPGFFAERFAAALQLLVVAISEGTLLGFSLMANGHIDMLFVDPACQGSGVGRRLLAEAEARGASSLECFRANFAARRFYEGRGWRLAQAYARAFAGAEHEFVRYEKPTAGNRSWSGTDIRRRTGGGPRR